MNCSNFNNAPTSQIGEVVAVGSSGLQYMGDDNWNFNWKALTNHANQCRSMVLKLNDGNQHKADFKFFAK